MKAIQEFIEKICEKVYVGELEELKLEAEKELERMNKEAEYAELGNALDWAQNQCYYDWFYSEQDGTDEHKWFNEEILLKKFRESQKEGNYGAD